jgi:hypothetical protein
MRGEAIMRATPRASRFLAAAAWTFVGLFATRGSAKTARLVFRERNAERK